MKGTIQIKYMKIPEKIKVGGFDWSIIQSRDVANEGNCFGSTHYISQSIFIEPEIPNQQKEQTIIHEILHVLWWQAGLNERFKKTPEIEEEIVAVLSHGLYQVLKDNEGFNYKKNDTRLKHKSSPNANVPPNVNPF